MRILAISDLHLSYRANREALAELQEHPDDWLLLGGDLGETVAHLELALDAFCPRFAKVFWAPGNHNLWTTSGEAGLRGEERYLRMVEVCRSRGVRTPEDPYEGVELGGQVLVIAPLFLLFDYSFRPDEVPLEGVVAWAAEDQHRQRGRAVPQSVAVPEPRRLVRGALPRRGGAALEGPPGAPAGAG